MCCSTPLCAKELGANGSTLNQTQKIASAELFRDQGNYPLAEQLLTEVLGQAEREGDLVMQAMATAALGYNYYLVRNDVKTQLMLSKALNLARPLGYPALTALIQEYLGMMQVALQQPELAAGSFKLALLDANAANDQSLRLSILLNQSKLEIDLDKQLTQLQSLAVEIQKLPNSALKANLLLNLAELLLPKAIIENGSIIKQTFQILDEALNGAKQLHLTRVQIQAQKLLATLYAQQHREQDALVWLDQAVFTAQQANAKDLLMQLETQRAEILQKMGNLSGSLEAYRRAIQQLVDIRHDIPVYLHDGQSSITQLIDPTYRGSANVLLSLSSQTKIPEFKQVLLKEAIGVMEASKQAELEDFFKDRCLIEESVDTNILEKMLPGAVIIYPVIFPDRIELLFRFGDSLEILQKTVNISSAELATNAVLISERLREGKDYRLASYKLFNWIIRPFIQELAQKKIDTLVFVPDGALRQVPLAALNDGQHFLVEKYASVTLPGLTLKHMPESPASHKKRALIVGLSKPDGASLDQLAPNYVKMFLGERGLSADEKSLLISLASKDYVKGSRRAELVSDLSLPGIALEVALLQKKMPNITLINQSFTFQEFQRQLESGEFSIVHIASHGYFGRHAADSFIMAYDRNFKLTEFQSLLNSNNLSRSPIDLLTLNACETAYGDDRALLGFSGIAIKTNTQSAIGTLWPINDIAAAEFMSEFYGQLDLQSKAGALRQAQLMMLKSPKFNHPYYWSPFILVGNWQ
jgi:CHAT domain-containing protein